MFEKAEKILDEMEDEMQSKMMMLESLVVTGQRMANLLKEMGDEFGGEWGNEARELVMRWEKEFK
jgi:hypothetical protein